METNTSGRQLADFYLRRAGFIGCLYGVVPVLVWFTVMFTTIPFREVYVLRLVLSLAIAGASGAYLNRYGLRFWLIKHNSRLGPATVLDGMLIGAAIGLGTSLFAPLTALISSHHLEEAKSFIIICWLLAAAIGFAWGGIVTSIGVKHINREKCLDLER